MQKKNLFSRNIKLLRKKSGLKQEYVAAKCNCSRQTVSNWENGNGTATVDSLIALSKLFNVSIEELIYGPEVFINAFNEAMEKYVNSYDYQDKHYIELMKAPGYYCIDISDMNDFVGLIQIDANDFFAIVLELSRRGIKIAELWCSGFSINIESENELETLKRNIMDIVDIHFMHANFLKPSEVLEDTERLGEIINEASERVLKYCNKQLFGEAIYYWMDEKNVVRGHGKTEEECRIQANRMGYQDISVNTLDM